MKRKSILFIALVCFLLSQGLSAQQTNMTYVDVVYLKNGSVIKGIIVENTPNSGIKLKTADGNIFVYNYTDIEKFAKEESPINKTQVAYHYNEKSPGLAFVFSFLLPGGGQYYNGQITKGVTMTALYLGSYCMMLGAEDEGTLLLGCTVLLGDYLWSVIDAPVSAGILNKKNREGLASIKIGKNSYLSLSPDLKLVQEPTLCLGSRVEPIVGMKLKLSL